MVNLREGILIRANGLRRVRGSASQDVATNDGEVGKNFPDFRVRRNEIA
jgi:hypothetical protein